MDQIEIHDLNKSFADVSVLNNLNLRVSKGEVVAVIGNSGCGKSLLLRLMEGLEKPDSGQVYIEGREISARGAEIEKIRQTMGMVYQDFGLFSHLNVMENLCLAPIKLKGMDLNLAQERALQWLKTVGLEEWAYEDVKNLSGGQKQRIAICRCMMMDPQIVLFDEPTSALDPCMVGEVLATIRLLAKRGLTMVIVTHEMSFAYQIADRILFMADGRIYEEGTPSQIFNNPQKEKTIAFIRKLKYTGFKIDSPKYDLMKLHGQIQDFGNRYGLSFNEIYRLQICAEEMIGEILKTSFKDQEKVNLNLEISYSEKDRGCEICFTSSEKLQDPFKKIRDIQTELYDHLGLLIIYNKASGYKYSCVSGQSEILIRL